jgi:hypothetical protein
MPIFMSEQCTGCETGCPKAVPQCTAAALFCTPSAPGEFAPMGSYQNLSSSPCERSRPAGTLGGVNVCMGCFGGASHSRFYTMARADVTIDAETPLVLKDLVFGALVRTAPAIDRIWGNVGIGFGSTWLAQLDITAMLFHFRAGTSWLTFNPSPATYSSWPSTTFSTASNREVVVALLVDGRESGGATFHIDTGNEGISIADDRLAASMASTTGGRWASGGHDGLTVPFTPATAPPITIAIGSVRAVIPGSTWVVDGTGKTIFSRYGKNVLGLPFIMAGDLVFDDAHETMYFKSDVAGGSMINSDDKAAAKLIPGPSPTDWDDAASVLGVNTHNGFPMSETELDLLQQAGFRWI